MNAQSNTPTPGDLSARHVIAEAIKLANGGSFNTPADVADWLRDELAALSALPAGGEPVAWCALKGDGSIAYFDGKPMVMPGKVGNEHHPVPLYTTPPPEAASPVAEGCSKCGSEWPASECACSCIAAPAAGKGVDDAMVERAGKILAKRWNDPSRENFQLWSADVRAALEAALTRQPVAGDGMVLVPREPTEAMLEALRKKALENAKDRHDDMPADENIK